MPYTMEDFDREFNEKFLKRMTPEERMKGIPAEERLLGLSIEERRKLREELDRELQTAVPARKKIRKSSP